MESHRIAEAGGIAVILSGMKAHKDHAEVQAHGCHGLANLATNTDNRVSIAEVGGITVIVSGMTAHMDQAGVQRQGCCALLDKQKLLLLLK